MLLGFLERFMATLVRTPSQQQQTRPQTQPSTMRRQPGSSTPRFYTAKYTAPLYVDYRGNLKIAVRDEDTERQKMERWTMCRDDTDLVMRAHVPWDSSIDGTEFMRLKAAFLQNDDNRQVVYAELMRDRDPAVDREEEEALFRVLRQELRSVKLDLVTDRASGQWQVIKRHPTKGHVYFMAPVHQRVCVPLQPADVHEYVSPIGDLV